VIHINVFLGSGNFFEFSVEQCSKATLDGRIPAALGMVEILLVHVIISSGAGFCPSYHQ